MSTVVELAEDQRALAAECVQAALGEIDSRAEEPGYRDALETLAGLTREARFAVSEFELEILIGVVIWLDNVYESRSGDEYREDLRALVDTVSAYAPQA